MDALVEILQASAARHTHLCPRQVLGARMGRYGLDLLGLTAPVTRATALIVIEADGCFADAIEIATGATVGHRTLRIRDYGKIAATFADVKTERTLRVFPVVDVRERAWRYAPGEHDHYRAQLVGYQVMPPEEMFVVQSVQLQPSLAGLISQPNLRVNCDRCREEIINNRQVHRVREILCQTCAGKSYYLTENSLARDAISRQGVQHLPSVDVEK